jgi:hypothetical protein
LSQVLRFPWSPSTAPMGLSFAQDMMPKPSQPGMLQGDVHGMANLDMFRTIMQSFSREPQSQVCSLPCLYCIPSISWLDDVFDTGTVFQICFWPVTCTIVYV